MIQQETFRWGLDGLVLHDTLRTDPLLEKYRCTTYDNSVLLAAAHSALQAVGLGFGLPELSSVQHEGAFSTMRTMHDASDKERPPVAVITQNSLPYNRWELGPTNVRFGGGSSPQTFHAAAFEATERLLATGLRLPRILASHEDSTKTPPDITFDIQEFVFGQKLAEYVAEHPGNATQVIDEMAKQLVVIHDQRPDSESFGYLRPDYARQGYLIGNYKNAREHYLSTLGQLLLEMHSAQLITAESASSLNRFFLTSPIIDKLAHDPRILHGDFGPENTVISADGRSQIIDLGFVASGPPEYDLAILEEVLDLYGMHEYWPAFLSAYQRAGGEMRDDFDSTYRATRLRATVSRVAGMSAILPFTEADVQEGLRNRIQSKLRLLEDDAAHLGVRLS